VKKAGSLARRQSAGRFGPAGDALALASVRLPSVGPFPTSTFIFLAGNSPPVASIALHLVSKEFPGRGGRTVRALDQLSLDLPSGHWLSVVGPSGSGKTTLLRLVAGLDAPTTGTVKIDGQVVRLWDERPSEVAMVFQRDALLPHLTARENIALGLQLRGHARNEIATRLAEAEELFQLGSALDRLPRAISGGERQRAALARAYVRRPRVLLLDEPLSSLDAPLRTELRRQLREFQRRIGSTVIHVTHDQHEAMALGETVAVLCQGALQQSDSPLSLYQQPANAFVAGFIGSPPMNLFRGRLRHQGGAVWFRAEDGPDGLAICLPETQGRVLQELGRVGPELLLGLRAEDIVDADAAQAVPFGCAISAAPEAFEHLGAETQVRWRCGRSVFVTRSAPGAIGAIGVDVPLVFDLAQAHFFDGATGQALALKTALPLENR
jgi:multiple sugar transport system ATP-binding protein